MVFPDCKLAGCFTPGLAAGLCKAALSISVQGEKAQAACAQGGQQVRDSRWKKQLAPYFQGKESKHFRSGDVPQ